MSSRALVVLAAAAAILGCGKSAEEQRMENVRRACEGLVPGTSTLLQADAALNGAARAMVCDSFSSPMGDPDVCDYGAPVCQFDYAYYLSGAACAPASTCWYGCGIRTSQADWDTNRWDATVCARFFYGPQPLPLIRRN